MLHNILVLNSHGLGDVVMSFPFFENLLLVSENKKIIVIFKSNLELELFELTKLYDNNQDKFILFVMKDISKLFIYIFRIEQAYSLGVNENKSEKLFRLLFIKNYYIVNPYNYDISNKVNILNNESKIHKSKLYASLLQMHFDIDLRIEYKDYFIDYENKLKFENYIVFTGGSGELEKHKRWTTSGYHNLLIKIIDDTKYKVLFVGSQSEQEIVDEVLNDLKNKYLEKIVQMNGKTSLLELISILRNSELVVGNDNGVLHIASACNTQILGLFGSTDYKITGPVGNYVDIIDNKIECAPCYAKAGNILGCEDNICMKQINYRDVNRKIMEIIKI